MGKTIERKQPLAFAVWLIIASMLGLTAAFMLTLEKLHSLSNPAAGASCDFSVIVQCTANLNSAQGAIFGFPNPLIGLMAWPFVLVTGVLLLLKVRLPKIYWGLFLLGNSLGVIFVCWLIIQSIYVIGTLCPWCMVTWIAMIPTFIAVLFHAGAEGVFSSRAMIVFTKLKPYVFALTVIILATIAFLANMRLDWVSTL